MGSSENAARAELFVLGTSRNAGRSEHFRRIWAANWRPSLPSAKPRDAVYCVQGDGQFLWPLQEEGCSVVRYLADAFEVAVAGAFASQVDDARTGPAPPPPPRQYAPATEADLGDAILVPCGADAMGASDLTTPDDSHTSEYFATDGVRRQPRLRAKRREVARDAWIHKEMADAALNYPASFPDLFADKLTGKPVAEPSEPLIVGWSSNSDFDQARSGRCAPLIDHIAALFAKNDDDAVVDDAGVWGGAQRAAVHVFEAWLEPNKAGGFGPWSDRALDPLTEGWTGAATYFDHIHSRQFIRYLAGSLNVEIVHFGVICLWPMILCSNCLHTGLIAVNRTTTPSGPKLYASQSTLQPQQFSACHWNVAFRC